MLLLHQPTCGVCSEIFAGSVFLYRNSYLCFDDTIEWRDILSGEGAEVVAERQQSRACEFGCCVAILSLSSILHLLMVICYSWPRFSQTFLILHRLLVVSCLHCNQAFAWHAAGSMPRVTTVAATTIGWMALTYLLISNFLKVSSPLQDGAYFHHLALISEKKLIRS